MDSIETLRWLITTHRLGEIPPDPGMLVEQVNADVTFLKLAIMALTDSDDGVMLCCRGRGARRLSDVHLEAHAFAYRVASDATTRAANRARLVADLHRLKGST